MNAYPHVLGERKTLDLVLAGRSIARYGDGEFKLCTGGAAKAQELTETIQRRLVDILRSSGECLVGIPNVHSKTPKAELWESQGARALRYLVDREYVSSFITRPDSAPWIDTPDYWDALETLWVGQDVTLVRGSSKSLTAEDLVAAGAGQVREIIAPRQHSFAEYDALMERIGTPKRAILCLGPAATVMAVDLCAKGVHAIDAGHIGMFRRKHLRGEPMWVTKGDKEAA